MFTTQSQVSFHHRLSLYLFYPLPPPFPYRNHLLLSVSMRFVVFCLIPSHISTSPQPPPSESCQSVLYVWVCFCLFCSLDCTNEGTHMPFVSLWLVISVSIILSRSIHSVKESKTSFLRASSTPLYKCTKAFLSTHLLMGMGCFQILAIVNSTAMNRGVKFLEAPQHCDYQDWLQSLAVLV